MIFMQESTTKHLCKPVICPKCNRGRLGKIPEHSEAVLSRRGNPSRNEPGDYVQVKCYVCRSLWTLTIANIDDCKM